MDRTGQQGHDPLFYVLFVGLAIYLFTLPASGAGYQYIFVLDPKGLLDPVVWIYALGQAFFSLSVAGNGTLIYGSYLSRSSNVPSDARMVAVFDTVAALLAALVIIPAMAVAGQQLVRRPLTSCSSICQRAQHHPRRLADPDPFLCCGDLRGPHLSGQPVRGAYRHSPGVVPPEAPRRRSHHRGAGILVGLVIAPIVDPWMNICSIYICPLGALLAAVMFFWICGRQFVEEQVNLARTRPLGPWFYPLGKYLFCGVTWQCSFWAP